MGLLNKMFGGGTKLELKLDATQIPEGGLLSGSLLLHGGKKPLTMDALKVRLVYVKVTTVPGQSLPKIEMQSLIDNTIASKAPLAPGSLSKFSFTLTVPKGTDPKGTYKVMAVADIPGVADPTADADLKVVPAVERGMFGFAKGAAAATGQEVLDRFPGLRSENENTLCDAFHELVMASYEPESNLLAAEPLLARHMREGTERVRERALDAWGTLLNNRARPEHIRALEAMAAEPGTSQRLLFQVGEVAAKFAEEGALPLVTRLAKHTDPEVRAHLATDLYVNAEPKLKERKALLLQLAQDTDGGVRAAAFAAFSSFAEDPKAVGLVASALDNDRSPDVQKACIRALGITPHYGHKELVFKTYTAHLRNPHPEVRMEIADSIHSLPADPRLTALVTGLLADSSVEVRRRMAWQSVNMEEHPELASLFIKTASEDPALEVRADALYGLARLMPIGDAVAFYRKRLAADLSESVGFNVANGLRSHLEEPIAKQLLTELTKSQYSRVAEHAKSVLSGS